MGDDTPADGVGDETSDATASDRLHRATIEFGLDDAQAESFESLTAMVDDDTPVEAGAAVVALAAPDVAEAAWTRWSDDEALGGPADDLGDALGDAAADAAGGVAGLAARQHLHRGRLDDAIATLEGARSSGHRLVLCELAALAADRSDPLGAQQLLRDAGVNVDIDLDAPYDPRTADHGFGAELAEEIAPFAAVRPKPMAGRNDRCPCGSGKKYKACHLGDELHPLADRAGWLYVKLMRFMGIHEPNLAGALAADLVEHVAADDVRDMVHNSYLPVDLAVFEGGVAQRFVDTKGSLLPPDEAAMLDAWVAQPRRVYEVIRSRPGAMELADLTTRERATVVDTVPDEPLDAGWLVTTRLAAVGDSHRAYGGFLPVNADMVAALSEAFDTGSLETTVLAISQIFDTAAGHDEMAELFSSSLDTTELREMLEDLADD